MTWKDIYNIQFIDAPGCWESCSSYCCSNFHAEKMSLLSGRGVVLPLFPGEWEHQISLGVQERQGFEHRMDTYTLSDCTEWKQHFLFCSCEGQCNPHETRPLICRIYPYFPIVTIDGDITDFEYSSLMDLCYTTPKTDHPCTLVRKQEKEIKGSLTRAMSFLKERPDMIFSFMVFQRLASTFKKAMGMTLDMSQPSDHFFKKFEWLVFSRKAWKKQDFMEGIEQDLQAVRSKYGKFDLN